MSGASQTRCCADSRVFSCACLQLSITAVGLSALSLGMCNIVTLEDVCTSHNAATLVNISQLALTRKCAEDALFPALIVLHSAVAALLG